MWENGGCSSWYRDKFGKITTLWPGFTFNFRRQTRTFDLNAYHAMSARELPPSPGDPRPRHRTTSWQRVLADGAGQALKAQRNQRE